MRSTFVFATCLGLALLPLSAVGQDTADTTSPTPGDLSLGTPENGEPQIGQTYVADVFTDWELRCVRTEDGNDPCQLYQLLSDAEGNAVAEFNMFPLPEGQEAAGGATAITPLETLLPAQLRIAVDGSPAKRYPYAFCTQIGCYSRIGFLQEEIDQFKRGARATVTIVAAAAPDEPVELDLSLSGFTAAWDRVTSEVAAEE